MPRRRRPKGPAQITVALVVCRDAYHRDEEGFAERGFHVAGELLADPATGRRTWTGPGHERGAILVPGMVLVNVLPAGTPPLKRYRTGGAAVWRIRCACGDDRQVAEARITAIMTAWAKRFPGAPCEIPMERL